MNDTEYVAKYLNKSKARKHKRRLSPERWVSGPDPITRDIYYGYIKHKAQAAFRNEDYELTWEDWKSYWDLDTWMKRGRHPGDICLARVDHLGPWSKENCYLVERREYLKRQGEFRTKK